MELVCRRRWATSTPWASPRTTMRRCSTGGDDLRSSTAAGRRSLNGLVALTKAPAEDWAQFVAFCGLLEVYGAGSTRKLGRRDKLRCLGRLGVHLARGKQSAS
eukprot:16446064-Heterocapsa_arctica.AAC.1